MIHRVLFYETLWTEERLTKGMKRSRIKLWKKFPQLCGWYPNGCK